MLANLCGSQTSIAILFAGLKIALDRRASDLHLKVGNNPIVRIDGHLMPLENQARISQEEVIEVAFSIMSSGPGVSPGRCHSCIRGSLGVPCGPPRTAASR